MTEITFVAKQRDHKYYTLDGIEINRPIYCKQIESVDELTDNEKHQLLIDHKSMYDTLGQIHVAATFPAINIKTQKGQIEYSW